MAASCTPDQQVLVDLWEEHVKHEFATCSVEETMRTIVDEPHVIAGAESARKVLDPTLPSNELIERAARS